MNISHTIICCHILWYVIISYVIIDPICFIIWHMYFIIYILPFFHRIYIYILSFLVYLVLSDVIIVHHINIFRCILFHQICFILFMSSHFIIFPMFFGSVMLDASVTKKNNWIHNTSNYTQKSLSWRWDLLQWPGWRQSHDHVIGRLWWHRWHGGNRGPFCILWCSWLVTLRWSQL